MTTPPHESDEVDEPVTEVAVDEENSLGPAPDEEGPIEMIDAARQELEYPADETDEG